MEYTKKEIPNRTQRRKPPDCLTQSSAETKSKGLARSMTIPQVSLQRDTKTANHRRLAVVVL